MSPLPLDPLRYPYYEYERWSRRLHADRAQDVAVHRLLARLLTDWWRG